MEIIKSIQIRKFRSIKSITRDLSPSNLNIFVGQNDQGKSNVLRALNLFFNNQTDPGQPFRFDDDYCYHANTGTGTRREIRIDLVIHPPKHRFKHARPVRWTRRWRRDGSISEDKLDLATGEPLSQKNNVYKWLDKLRYRYVPAIKGPEYFTMLMGELHDVLNESHEEVLNDQGEDFISGIREVTQEITRDLEEQIGIPSTIQVPSDFRLLFSNLDFGAQLNGNTYHLKQRGDGIKVRHIPVVLKYMSDQEKSVSVPGYVKPDTIWGFEEPENNLELRYAFQLADRFKQYSSDIQIFLTTHSPAFYALDQTDNDGVNTYYVDQGQDGCTGIKRVTPHDTDELHEKMGLLPIITPYLSEIYEHQQKILKLTEELDQLNADTRCFVLTEDENYRHVEKYFEINGFNLDQTEFVPYFGADQIKAAMLLAGYIAEKYPEASIVIHRDRDYHNDATINKLQAKIEKKGFCLFVTKGVDVEAEYLCPHHVNSVYPEISVDLATQYIDSATEQAEQDSISRLVDQFFKLESPKDGAFYKKFDELRDVYHADKPRYRYGKKVCGYLKSKIQRKIKQNPNLFQRSKHVENELLKEISERVW